MTTMRTTALLLLAFSLAAHLVFSLTRAMIGLLWLPAAYLDLQLAQRVGAGG